MDRIVERNILYDFYGELLTEHQKQIYKDAVYEDLSLSELADEYGISRQGVHDIIRRCDRILEGYEAKLHLVEKFKNIKASVGLIKDTAENKEIDKDLAIRRINDLSDKILNTL